MPLTIRTTLLATACLGAMPSAPAFAQNSDSCSDLSNNSAPIEYRLAAPTKAAAQRLFDQIDYQRAIQMYMWALPAAATEQYNLSNTEAMGGGSHEGKIGYLGSLLKSNVLHPTGNPDSMYIDYFFDTRSGPIALEAPPELPGFLDDMWEVPVIDIIQPVSPAGKYLIVPPNWTGNAPADFVVARPKTYGSWMLLRGNVARDGSTTEAVGVMKEKLKIYPLSELGARPSKPLQFFDLSDSTMNRLPPEGLRYFEVLGGLVEREHPTMQEPYVMGMLKALGMEAGKPFTPDERMKRILTCAERMGRVMARAIMFYKQEPQWKDRHFTQAFIGGSAEFMANGAALHDARTLYFYGANGTSKLMTSRRMWAKPILPAISTATEISSTAVRPIGYGCRQTSPRSSIGPSRSTTTRRDRSSTTARPPRVSPPSRVLRPMRMGPTISTSAQTHRLERKRISSRRFGEKAGFFCSGCTGRRRRISMEIGDPTI